MTIRLVCIGKTQSAWIRDGLEEYIRRINRYTRFEIVELPDTKNTRNMDQQTRKRDESERLGAYIQPGTFTILLDEAGKNPGSVALARQLENWLVQGHKTIQFFIGGPYGFTDELRARAGFALSLSAMTFSHELVRLVFAEQLYRAYTIINNEPYHHG